MEHTETSRLHLQGLGGRNELLQLSWQDYPPICRAHVRACCLFHLLVVILGRQPHILPAFTSERVLPMSHLSCEL